MEFLSARQFWQLKISQPPVHDLVLAGNSRVLLGLSPRHLAEHLPGRMIYNFGFAACPLDTPYLEHAARLLKPESREPGLVLGVSPHGLLPVSRTNATLGYLYWSTQEQAEHRALLHKIIRDNRNGTALLRYAFRNLLNLSRGQPLNRYHADGWEASLPWRRNPNDYAQRVQKVYQRRKVSSVMVEQMLDKVAAFRQRGIAVYGFRPPCAQSVQEVEELASGLNFQELARRFGSAGGCWLEVDHAFFPTYDGVHMCHKSAVRFSRHLGRLIHERSLQEPKA